MKRQPDQWLRLCTDYTKEAAKAGETSTRLHLVAVRSDGVTAERAALGWRSRHAHRRRGRGVTDELWANAAKHYDEEQLAALVAIIASSTPTPA
ncbi:Alkyl hydroperoxide reductase AhpD OS=Streptomyces antimycoticus OX=68175 GN=SANT12839_013520 PE=4 SV=1 [Streptomyces antimycoticus]